MNHNKKSRIIYFVMFSGYSSIGDRCLINNDIIYEMKQYSKRGLHNLYNTLLLY